MRMGILAYDGCVAGGVSGFADVLAVANHVAGRAVFTVRVVSAGGRPVQPFAGPPLAVDGPMDGPMDDPRDAPRDAPRDDPRDVPMDDPRDALRDDPRDALRDAPINATEGEEAIWDGVYVPPAFGFAGPPAPLVAWLRRAHASGAIACAACAGVFFLAEAGLLEGRAATTHWGLAQAFRARYPGVRLEPERLLVDGGDYVCAAGLTAYFDLALHLVARFASPEVAASCARTLLLDPGRASQTPYMSLLGPCAQGDAHMAKAQEWLEKNHTRTLRPGELAAAVTLGERTLLRRFKKATGRTPGAYLQALRIEHAKRLLESGTLSVDEIVATVGYQDTPAFFRLFKEMTGLTPGGYRSRFSVLGAGGG